MVYRSILKKGICYALITMQLLGSNLVPSAYAATEPDDLIDPMVKLITHKAADQELLIAEILKSPDFVKDHALLAHYMGVAWCGGTGSQEVGEDFDFKKVNENTFTLTAHYDPNDPYAGGIRADERLVMEFSDVKLYIDEDTFELGDPEVYAFMPKAAQTKIIRNAGTEPLTSSLSYTSTESTSESETVEDSIGVGATVGYSYTQAFDAALYKSEHTVEVTASFDYGHTWGTTHENSSEQQRTTTDEPVVPPNRKLKITQFAFSDKVDVPYKANVYLSYNVKFTGFFRADANSTIGHDTSRPDANIVFGTAPGGSVRGYNGPEHIHEQYIHRSITGNSDYDWDWITERYPEKDLPPNEEDHYSFKRVMGRIAHQRHGAAITGKYTNISGMHFDSLVTDLGPLDGSDAGKPPVSDTTSPEIDLTPVKVTYVSTPTGLGTVPVDILNYGKGQNVTVSDNTGNLDVYPFIFAGWNTMNDGRGTQYQPGEIFKIQSDTTLYAQWAYREQEWYVSYLDRYATSGDLPYDSNGYHTGTKATVLGNSGNLERTGYEFAGWNTAEDGSGKVYKAGDAITMGGAHVSLYAQWRLIASLK